MRSSVLVFVLMAWMAGGAWAARIEKPLADPVAEQQARTLFSALKCVVCEGQSLADSDAQLAVQMRAQIREMMGSGKSPEEVLAFFRASYGDRILMQPPLQQATALLWLAPMLVLLLGGFVIWRITHSRRIAA